MPKLLTRQQLTLRAPVFMVFDWVESPACWPLWDRSIRSVDATFRLARDAEDQAGPFRVRSRWSTWEGRFVRWQRGCAVEIEIASGRYLGLRAGRLVRRYEHVPLGCSLELSVEVPEPQTVTAWRRRRLIGHVERCLARIRHGVEGHGGE